MIAYEGSIEDVLASGEYDSGDVAVVPYDELYDLAEQVRILTSELSFCDRDTLSRDDKESLRSLIERKTNRPLHPVLGGKSPYTEFLPL